MHAQTRVSHTRMYARPNAQIHTNANLATPDHIPHTRIDALDMHMHSFGHVHVIYRTTRMRLCTESNTHPRTHLYTHTHTRRHLHAHTCTHTHMQVHTAPLTYTISCSTRTCYTTHSPRRKKRHTRQAETHALTLMPRKNEHRHLPGRMDRYRHPHSHLSPFAAPHAHAHGFECDDCSFYLTSINAVLAMSFSIVSHASTVW